MESRIPIPTDNIYKFYALFSLVLLVFCAGALIYLNSSTNEANLEYLIEIETLKSVDNMSSLEELKLEVLNRLYDVSNSNKEYFLKILSVLMAISLFGISIGFWRWHTVIQPRQDELFDIKLKIEKYQLEKITSEVLQQNKKIKSYAIEDTFKS